MSNLIYSIEHYTVDQLDFASLDADIVSIERFERGNLWNDLDFFVEREQDVKAICVTDVVGLVGEISFVV
jgi:hypothetical protein